MALGDAVGVMLALGLDACSWGYACVGRSRLMGRRFFVSFAKRAGSAHLLLHFVHFVLEFLGGVDDQILTDRSRIRPWSLLNYRVRGGALRPVDVDRRDIGRQRHEAPLRPLRRCQRFLLPRSDPGARSKGDCEGPAAAGAPLTDCPDAPHSTGPSVPSPPLLSRRHASHSD